MCLIRVFIEQYYSVLYMRLLVLKIWYQDSNHNNAHRKTFPIYITSVSCEMGVSNNTRVVLSACSERVKPKYYMRDTQAWHSMSKSTSLGDPRPKGADLPFLALSYIYVQLV